MARWHSCGNSVILISCVLLYSNVTVWCGAAQPGSMARLFLFTPVSAGTKSPGGWLGWAGRAGPGRCCCCCGPTWPPVFVLIWPPATLSPAQLLSAPASARTRHVTCSPQPSPASPVLITPAQAAQHLAIEWPPGPAQQPSSPPAATSWARHGHTGAGCLLYFSPPRHLPTQRCQTRASAMLSSGSWMQSQLLFTIPVWPRCSLLLLLLCCSARVPACLAMWQLAAAASLRKLKVFLETFSGVREEKAW